MTARSEALNEPILDFDPALPAGQAGNLFDDEGIGHAALRLGSSRRVSDFARVVNAGRR
jgi:hypothetical protein